MQIINIYEEKNSGILLVYSIRNSILIDPDYQRMGGIWTLEKRQLLIDSILNGFDIPKLYFHKFVNPKEGKKGNLFKYAIIDGRQRLETIWSFIDGKFSLGEEFEYYEDSSIKAAGLSYADLAKEYPHLKLIFDQTSLPIINVETDDIDIIEEMFSRLNEAVPLNAAEKRNAFGGPMVKAIAKVSEHKFFLNNIQFSNKRYQHREVAAKFILLDYSDRIIDTKKAFLDKLVKDFRGRTYDAVINNVNRIETVLEEMTKVFKEKDPLLKTQGMVVIYFLIFRNLSLEDYFLKDISRKVFIEFEQLRNSNRKSAEIDIASAKYELLEFDRAASQGINDAASIRFRYLTLEKFLKAYLINKKGVLEIFE